MRALLDRLRLPAGYVQALDPCEASARAGVSHRASGLVLSRRRLDRAARPCPVVHRARRLAASKSARARRWLRSSRADDLWHLLDASGGRIASASVLVLAGGGESLRLIGGEWPVEPVRGQISIGRVDARPDLRLPRLPLTGAGFVLPEIDGRVIFGATSDRGDAGIDLRRGDDERNLRQLVAPDAVTRSADARSRRAPSKDARRRAG